MKNYTFTRDDEEFAEILTMLSDYFMSYGEYRKTAYPKVYRFAKKLGVTVKALDNWYFTEVC